MTDPPLLTLRSAAEYRQHFERTLCALPLRTSNGTPIYFNKRDFNHAFFESSDRAGAKDLFSAPRSERMGWIELTLALGSATRVQGWDNKRKTLLPDRCVFHAFGDFVVVVRMSRAQDGSLKGTFITCIGADRSLAKILKAPPWTYADFVRWETRT